mgnify:CR=1 FL=1
MSLKPKSLTTDKKHVSVWSCPLSLLPFDIYICEREDLEKAVFYENEASLSFSESTINNSTLSKNIGNISIILSTVFCVK